MAEFRKMTSFRRFTALKANFALMHTATFCSIPTKTYEENFVKIWDYRADPATPLSRGASTP